MRGTATIRRGPVRGALRRPPGRPSSHKKWTRCRGPVSTAYTNGDTTFNFSNLNVGAGDNITMTLTFSASYGKITTVYDAGNPGGQMTVTNSCSDGAANWTSSGSGLRATVSGMSA